MPMACPSTLGRPSAVWKVYPSHTSCWWACGPDVIGPCPGRRAEPGRPGVAGCDLLGLGLAADRCSRSGEPGVDDRFADVVALGELAQGLPGGVKACGLLHRDRDAAGRAGASLPGLASLRCMVAAVTAYLAASSARVAPCRYSAAASGTATGLLAGRTVTSAACSRALIVSGQTPYRAAMAAMVSPVPYSSAIAAAGMSRKTRGALRNGAWMPRALSWPRTASTPTW